MSARELARDLGVSHNLIPQRIGSKEELWRAAVDQGFGRLLVALATSLDDVPSDADDLTRLQAMVTRFIEANAGRPALLRVISREAVAPGPRFDYLYDGYIDPVRAMGAELLAGLEAEGKVRPEATVGLMYFFMMHGAGGSLAMPALAERMGEGVDPADPVAVRRHAEATAELLFRGFRQ